MRQSNPAAYLLFCREFPKSSLVILEQGTAVVRLLDDSKWPDLFLAESVSSSLHFKRAEKPVPRLTSGTHVLPAALSHAWVRVAALSYATSVEKVPPFPR